MRSIPSVYGYSRATGGFSTDPFITIFETRDPTGFDINYSIQQRWININSGTEWILVNVQVVSGVPFANWLMLTAGGTVPTRNYTNVTFADSPYTVQSLDEFISVDTSGGPVTLLFPDSPTFKRIWTVKDRTGNASENPILITSVTAITSVDGTTTYHIRSNYAAINLIANNNPAYEIY